MPTRNMKTDEKCMEIAFSLFRSDREPKYSEHGDEKAGSIIEKAKAIRRTRKMYNRRNMN